MIFKSRNFMQSIFCIILTSGWLAAHADTCHTLQEILASAERLDRQGDSRKALHALLQADQLEPNRPDILVKIAKQHGDLVTEHKDPNARRASAQAALEYSRRALKFTPNDSNAHLAMAISLGKMTEFMTPREKIENSREIKKHADRALALDPQSDYAHHMLGRWHQELAGIGGSTRALARVIYGRIPTASYEEAIKHFETARTLRPDRLIHQIEHGRTLAEMGKKDEAKAILQQGLDTPSRDKDDDEAKARARATLKRI